MKVMWGKTLALLLLLLVVWEQPLRSQTVDTNKTQPAHDRLLFRTRMERITEELRRSSKYPWAGSYTSGSIGFAGQTLAVGPQSGFIFQPYTDVIPSPVFDEFDFGDVQISEEGEPFLVSTRGNVTPGQYYFIKWGDRRFLIPEAYLPILANQANAGCADFRSDLNNIATLYFPTRREDLNRPLYGIPTLPEKFRSLLLPQPVNAMITAVGDGRSVKQFPDSNTHPWWDRYTRITIDRGKLDGLWPGLVMFTVMANRESELNYVTVKQVSDHMAEAEISVTYQGKIPKAPRLGTRLTSRLKPEWFSPHDMPHVCW